ncbi:GntR family transcriptional regulator [bacterium AH-315-E10]|nr:GntR family transcriptional regulator [bacterium AH-315-E10]
MKKSSIEHDISREISRRIHAGIYAMGSPLPKQREMAQEFQTSPTTISKALNHLQKRGLINAIPGHGTQVLPVDDRDDTGAVAIFCPRKGKLHDEPARILKGITDGLVARHQHYRLIYRSDYKYKRDFSKLYTDYSGFISMEDLGLETTIRAAEKKHFPYVIANLEQNSDFTCTWINHLRTTETAVRVLASFGHSRIALITRKSGNDFYKEALKGYKQGLRDVNIHFDKELIIISRNRGQDIRRITKRILSHNNAPTAFIACRDYLAHGVWQAAGDLNLRLGSDISIIGFDNLSWPEADSPLTTFDEPAYELGAKAADIIIERLIYGYNDVLRYEIEAPLVLRSSAGPCPMTSSITSELHLWRNR